MIDREVMQEVQHYPPILARVMSDINAHQRRLAYIEPIASWIEPGMQFFSHIAGSRIEAEFFNRQWRTAPYDLNRRGESFPQRRRAQYVVPINHRLQRL